MSRRVQLYIGGELADMAESSPVLWTWTREELDNPTVVRNSYTHQLTLPGTARNDAIFGAFQRVDRAYTPVVGKTTGIAFNPLKKASFALYDERSEVLARGYLKLDGIESRGEQAHGYKCTLYGGLGSLFYDLEMTADGEKRTLADLIYADANGDDLEPANTAMAVTWQTLSALWQGGLPPVWDNVLNFAPCYNGLPEGDFDANKAIVRSTTWYNFPTPQSGYEAQGGSGNPILATFTNKHTEWEMRDLRCWLQRPVVSVKAVLEALTDPRNTGDWTLVLDGGFFTDETNPWYDEAWMTLPLLSKEAGQDWATDLTLADALRGSCTPAAFLIGYAKTFGLVFDVDEAAMTVTLRTRDDYYADGTVRDMTERVDRRDISIVPVNASARWYEMKAGTVGEYAKEYETTYGRVYGSQRIDTGWEFDGDVRGLLRDYPFRGAADVLETSPLFYENYYAGYGVTRGLAVCDQEAVKYQLFNGAGDAQDFDAYVGQYLSKTVNWYNGTYNGSDVYAKPQLHGAGNKAEDGSGVLLIYTGQVNMPSGTGWIISGDTQAMTDLNGGRPCWLLSGDAGVDSTTANELPCYRRMAGSLTQDFGAPREIAVPGESTGEGATVYFNRWQGYLADRLDVDTKVLTAKVDMRGLKVGPALLRDFWHWRNSLWSLNRIKDYAPTVDGLVECEFVLVGDADAYTDSQAVPELENYYLNASPGTLGYVAGGEGKTITITANVSWTLTKPAWITASAASGSGNATVTLTAAANTGSARTGTVAITGDHSTSASVALSQDAAPEAQLSLDRAGTTYTNYTSKSLSTSVSSNVSWSASSSQSWAVVSGGTGTGNGSFWVSLTQNTGGSTRTATITVVTTSGTPTVTRTFTISQSAQPATTTYALVLGAASHAFAASGGSYTLTAEGVTYVNGVESSRVTLSASDLDFAKSGSSALGRSDLVFSANDLGTTVTGATSATYTLTWRANGSQATFSTSQAANTRTQTGQTTSWTDDLPNPIVWEESQSSTADWEGDWYIPSRNVNERTVTTYSYTSGHTGSVTTDVVHTGTISVSGTGFYYVGTTLSCVQNDGHVDRSGTLTLSYNRGTAQEPDWYTVTRSLAQDHNPALPTFMTVQTGGDQFSYASPALRPQYPDALRWTKDDEGAPYQYLWTVQYPSVNEKAYSDGGLTTEVGTITNVTY